MKKRWLWVVAIGLLVSGCIIPRLEMANWEMGPKLQFEGFSVKRPVDKHWYLVLAEQYAELACFRMHTKSATHTIFTQIFLKKIETKPASIDEFEAYVKKECTAASPRNELLNFESHRRTMQGQWCIDYTITTRDSAAKNSNTPLLMTLKGFTVMHPTLPNTVVDAYVSQRGNDGELSPDMDVSGKAIIDSIILEPVPKKKP